VTAVDDKLKSLVYVDQVRSLYLNVTPALVMAGVFTINAALAYAATRAPVLMGLAAAGLLASFARIGVTVLLRNRALTAALDRSAARRLEILFAIPYTVFSGLLGAIGFYVFARAPTESQMVTICTIVGYCAGVATSCGLRPRLAISSIMLAVVPPIAVSLTGNVDHIGMATIASLFVFGGTRSILVRYKTSTAEISTRMVSVSLARMDDLTALPNRLALQEYFDQHSLVSPRGIIAAHFLDLDRFKPVNDTYGHAAGDELLLAVADRLRGAVRSSDIVARLGGDEFAVIQFGLNHGGEAELLAKRITAAIEQPYRVAGHNLLISASVGTVVSGDRPQSLDELLKAADESLYEVKRARAGRDHRPQVA